MADLHVLLWAEHVPAWLHHCLLRAGRCGQQANANESKCRQKLRRQPATSLIRRNVFLIESLISPRLYVVTVEYAAAKTAVAWWHSTSSRFCIRQLHVAANPSLS